MGTNPTLTNVLSLVTAPYWAIDADYSAYQKVMSQSPTVAHLRSTGRVFNTDTMKTGFQIADQDASDPVVTAGLNVSAPNEYFTYPSAESYNLLHFQKKIVLTHDELVMVERMYKYISRQSKGAKNLKSDLRANVEMLRNKYMPKHFRVMYRAIEKGIFGNLTGYGTNFKGLKAFLDPSSGPQTIGSTNLASLDAEDNQPLYITADGGTGAISNLGETLTGSAAIDYAEMVKWITVLQQVQMMRGNPYNLIIVSPTVNRYLAHLAEKRIVYHAPYTTTVERWNADGNAKVGGIPISSYSAKFSVNGLPVLVSPQCTSNNVWLINSDTLRLEFFVPEDKLAAMTSPAGKKSMEGLISVDARHTATTLSEWGDDVVMALQMFCQMSIDDPGSLAVINFDSTSTT